MSKRTEAINNFSSGMINDPDPKLIPVDSAYLLENVIINKPGRLIPSKGFSKKESVPNIQNPKFGDGFYSFMADYDENGNKNSTEFCVFQKSNTEIVIFPYGKTLQYEPYIVNNNLYKFEYHSGRLTIYPTIVKDDSQIYIYEFSNYDKFNFEGSQTRENVSEWSFYELEYDPDISINSSFFDDINSGSGDYFLKNIPYGQRNFVRIACFQDADIPANVELQQVSSLQGTYTFSYKGDSLTFFLPAMNDEDRAEFIAEKINSDTIKLSVKLRKENDEIFYKFTSDINGPEGNSALSVSNPFSGTGVPYMFGGSGAYLLTGGKKGSLFDDFDEMQTFDNTEYVFGASAIYYDGTESKITKAQPFTLHSNLNIFKIKISFSLSVKIANLFFGPDKNQKGVKIYLGRADDEMFFMTYFDFEKGIKYYENNSFKDPESVHSTLINDFFITDEIIPKRPAGASFLFETGFEEDDTVEAFYKHSTIANNRRFAFNIFQNNKSYQDRVLVSPVGVHNILPENNFLDISPQDGDEFISCVHFGPVLYAFKRNKVHLIDISSNDPSTFFIRSTLDNVGINNHSAACLTEFGVFWCNKNGIYAHNGEQIQNLTYGKIEDLWVSEDEDFSCGYDKISKKIFFIRKGNLSMLTLCYDLKTSSFVKFNSIFQVSDGDAIGKAGLIKLSNFATLDNKLSLISTDGNLSSIFKYEENNNPAKIKIVSRSYDMGQPSVRKKIRRFYISFGKKVPNNYIVFKYRIDSGEWLDILPERIENVNNENIIMFDLRRSVTAYSVQFMVESTNEISEEINDISIVYRMKLPK